MAEPTRINSRRSRSASNGHAPWPCFHCDKDMYGGGRVLMRDGLCFCSERCYFNHSKAKCPHNPGKCAHCCFKCFAADEKRRREVDNSSRVVSRDRNLYTGKTLWLDSEVVGKRKAADPDRARELEQEIMKGVS